MDEEKLKKKYMEFNGRKCPFCNYDILRREEIEESDQYIFQNAYCSKCGHSWVNTYELTDVEFYDESE